MQREVRVWCKSGPAVRLAFVGLGVVILLVLGEVALAIGNPTFRQFTAAKVSASNGTAWTAIGLGIALVALVLLTVQFTVLVTLSSAKRSRRRFGVVAAAVFGMLALVQGLGAIVAWLLSSQGVPALFLSLPLLGVAIGVIDVGAAITGWRYTHDP